MFDLDIIKRIKDGEVGVIPTDTIYGLACSIFHKEAIEKIYELKRRDLTKPFVFLISDISDLEKFNIQITEKVKNIISEYWPGPVSILFEDHNIPDYLHRGMKGLVIRLSNDPRLRWFLSKTGPIATSSANLEGEPPANNIEEAKGYFGDSVFYVDIGELSGKASKIIKIVDGIVEVIRN